MRGKAGADIASLADILVKMSRLAVDIPRLVEMDMNPVFSYGPDKGSRVVDVRLRLAATVKSGRLGHWFALMVTRLSSTATGFTNNSKPSSRAT